MRRVKAKRTRMPATASAVSSSVASHVSSRKSGDGLVYSGACKSWFNSLLSLCASSKSACSWAAMAAARAEAPSAHAAATAAPAPSASCSSQSVPRPSVSKRSWTSRAGSCQSASSEFVDDISCNAAFCASNCRIIVLCAESPSDAASFSRAATLAACNASFSNLSCATICRSTAVDSSPAGSSSEVGASPSSPSSWSSALWTSGFCAKRAARPRTCLWTSSTSAAEMMLRSFSGSRRWAAASATSPGKSSHESLPQPSSRDHAAEPSETRSCELDGELSVRAARQSAGFAETNPPAAPARATPARRAAMFKWSARRELA
mmetsp:Transcript_13062/g.45176  ORF Transcript_13062/g.45176 Transcript_13062/m.45176 type:complete len:320 (+) Transcript_13062:280-1239(+)